MRHSTHPPNQKEERRCAWVHGCMSASDRRLFWETVACQPQVSRWNANRNVKGTPGRGWAQQKIDWGGGRPSAGRPPSIHFLPWSSSAFPLAFLFAFHRETCVWQATVSQKNLLSDALCQTHFVKNSCAGFFLTKCIWQNNEKLKQIIKNDNKWQKHWHFWIWLQRK